MGMVMFPRVESDKAIVFAELPYGSSVEVTEQVQQRLIRAAESVIAENGGEKLSTGIFAYVFGHETIITVMLMVALLLMRVVQLATLTAISLAPALVQV